MPRQSQVNLAYLLIVNTLQQIKFPEINDFIRPKNHIYSHKIIRY